MIATSRDHIAYSVNFSIEGGELLNGGTPELSSFDPVTKALVILLQGKYDYTNETPTGNQRAIVPPCVRVIHNDPDISFFSFDTGLIPLIRTEGNLNDPVTVKNGFGLINDAIQATVPGQWEYPPYDSDHGEWTSTAVTYNEFYWRYWCSFPNDDGTYNFPSDRRHNSFEVSRFSSWW